MGGERRGRRRKRGGGEKKLSEAYHKSQLLDTYLRCCADELDSGTSRDGSFDLIGQWESKQVYTSLLRQCSDPEHLQQTNQPIK